MNTTDLKHRDLFLKGYLDCAAWCGLIPNEDGTDVVSDMTSEDFTSEAIKQAQSECDDFLDAVGEEGAELHEWSPQGAGHDFFLTRNRHGAGFWDRGYAPEAMASLTALAHSFGSADCYLNDAGEIDFA